MMLATTEDAGVSNLVREAIDALIERRLNERTPADPGTSTMLDDVLRCMDAKRPPLSQEEIDRDVADAVSDARSNRANRRRSI